jgi:O-antigen ligase
MMITEQLGESVDNVTKRSITEIIARVSFAVYLFFIIFGTSLPFGESIRDIDEKSTSNIVNQVVYSTLFLTSSFCLLVRRQSLWRLIRKEKFLTLFLAWCFLSIVWSHHSFISFKRFLQILTNVTIGLSIFIYTESPDEIIKYFRYILLFYIPLSLLSVIFIPGGLDPESTAWRGLASGKNHFGQVCLVSSLIWLSASSRRHLKEKIINLVMFILSLVSLIGSQSLTAILCALILGCLAGIFYLNRRFKSLGIGALFIILLFLTFLSISTSFLFVGPEFLKSLPEYVGKDFTFTGRTVLWEYIFDETKNHLFIGCGFGGFWVIDGYFLENVYKYFVWLPNQSHNGYLDILNETGLMGLSIFLIAVITYFIKLSRIQNNFIWKWFVIAALIINLQETTLFRMNVFTGVLFIFSYLALYADAIVRKRTSYQ